MSDFSSLLFPGQTFTDKDIEMMHEYFKDKKIGGLEVVLLFDTAILNKEPSGAYVRFNGLRLNLMEDWMNNAVLNVKLFQQPWPLSVMEDNGKRYCEVPLVLSRRNYNAWMKGAA